MVKNEMAILIKEDIHDTATTFYNDATSYLDEDIKNNPEEIKEQINRLNEKVHDEDIEIRDAWAEASGQAQYILGLAKKYDIEISNLDKTILGLIANLFL